MGAFLKNRWNYSEAFLICQHQNLQSNFIYFILNQNQIGRFPGAQKNHPSFIRTSMLCLFSGHAAIVPSKRKTGEKSPVHSNLSVYPVRVVTRCSWHGATFVCFTQKRAHGRCPAASAISASASAFMRSKSCRDMGTSREPATSSICSVFRAPHST